MYQILSNECLICSGTLEIAIELPNLPLTGIYYVNGQDKNFQNFDQGLLLCTNCGHAQLKNIIDVNYMYGEAYGFRTSSSVTASGGGNYFADFLDSLFPDKIFNSIVDFGCNDGYLLKLLKQRNKGKQYLGVDLIWEGNESDFVDDQIIISGEKIEDIDFNNVLDETPDLIVSQHTVEHIEDPKGLLEKLFLNTGHDTIFIFEFPCFDPLLENLRFDQVFHQHLHYYSVQSFLKLLGLLGAELIDYTINYNYWGALIIAFKKSKNSEVNLLIDCDEYFPEKTLTNVHSRFKSFKKQMELTADILDKLKDEIWYGYGAALMLPILGYHLNNDFSYFRAILDDDPAKDELDYINLPVSIQGPRDIDFSDINVLLTAMDNRRPILKKLAKLQPKRIINPLITL